MSGSAQDPAGVPVAHEQSTGIGAPGWLTIVVLALLLAVPVIAFYSGQTFYLDLATRLVCLAIAAVSLNLILGYGGMISFGHAAYIGIGAYAVGIPVYHETYGGFAAIAGYNGLWHIALAVAASALFALITGAISLRTRGVHFIMITMAFGQMVYFAINSLEIYGGDDGLVIEQRSQLPVISLDDAMTLYLFCFGVLVLCVYSVHRLVNSRFGMVVRGAKGNEERMRAIGYNTFAYRLTAYVISGAMCGLAGALLGNFTGFISSEMMDWTRSGELMFMVILGGAGTLAGPLLGAATFLLLEEIGSSYTIYWHLPFGIFLIAFVLFAHGGMAGLLTRLAARRG